MHDTRAVLAVLVVSFGGPEGPDDVMPFLRRVTAGRGVPDERLATVARQYEQLGGVSPLNAINRQLCADLHDRLGLPVYLGNRNWHPLLEATFQAMAADGVEKVVAFVTSAYSSYSGCRQYLEEMARANTMGLEVQKTRLFYNHPEFIAALVRSARAALDRLGVEGAHLVFTAHSIPTAMAATCEYEAQLQEVASAVAGALPGHPHHVAFQSRSGPPSVPWLEPDVGQVLEALAGAAPGAVVVPAGFVADHMEVLYDLDVLARATADRVGLPMERAATAGRDPAFPDLVASLVREVIDDTRDGPALGRPRWDCCGPGCCPAR